MEPFRSGRSLIVGLGKTGLSCARFLARRGVEVAVADTRTAPPGLSALREELPSVGVFLGEYDDHVFAAADHIVVSPGVSVHEPQIEAARLRGASVIGDIELFALCALAPVVAITGSNGKSTVTTLLGEMATKAGCKVAVGGNLGTPVLELLDYEAPELYVLELSSFQLETTYSLRPQAAVILNISEDHQDRYADLGSYLEAKKRIYAGSGVMVINQDDALLRGLCQRGRRCVRYSTAAPEIGDFGVLGSGGERFLAKGREPWMAAADLKIPGEHNLSNVLAAFALGDSIGLPRPAMTEAARRFTGLPHRVQFVAEINGVRYYDDSKGTNVAATLAAVDSMPDRVVLIAGGIGKGADFTPLAPLVERKGRALVLIGRDASVIESALHSRAPVVHAETLEQAVREAQRMAQVGDAVLLSPACASFDMFSGFEERGEVFTQAVRRLAG